MRPDVYGGAAGTAGMTGTFYTLFDRRSVVINYAFGNRNKIKIIDIHSLPLF